VTKTIPIVITSGSPVEGGLAESYAKPAGNVTGLTTFALELSGKRLELLKETVPKMTRLAALWSSSENISVMGFKETEDLAKALSLPMLSAELDPPGEMEKTFAELAKARVDALVVVLSPLITLHSKRIVELALKHRLPGMYPTRQFAEEGGLMAYGPLVDDLYRRAATYVDKILKGAKPADLPVEQPMKFELVINLKTAKQIGLTIPPNVLARADWVIK
jgi:putative ABC transport system substrate-binding protein